MTITETHIILFAGLTGYFNPLHTDETYCQNSKFKKRCIHGAFTSSFMSASIGEYFYGTAIALLELNTKFEAPVFPGNTLEALWTIERLTQNTNGGLLELKCQCKNESEVIVASATAKLLIK